MSTYRILDLQLRTETTTPKDRAAVYPVRPVPEGAEVLGELSPELRALLSIRDTLTELSVLLLEEYISRSGTMSPTEDAERLHHQGILAEEAHYYADKFFITLQREYERPVDYGPNFEVYALDKSPILLGDSLGRRIEADMKRSLLNRH